MVSIIIVNWNTRELLIDCLKSIEQNAPGCEVIVVDNASSDDSADAVRQQFSYVKLIASETNLGFAAGNNLGAQHVSNEYLLILNPDTIVHPGTIESLVSFLEAHPKVGLVAPELVAVDGRKQISSYGFWPSPAEAFLRCIRIWRIAPNSRLAQAYMPLPVVGEDVVYPAHVLGACMLLRHDLFRELGGFDEDYFLFLEETDLCLRLHRAEWSLAYYTGACITHVGEQSMQHILHRSGGLYIRSYNRFCRKYGMGLGKRVLVNLALIIGVCVDAGIMLFKHGGLRHSIDCLRSLWYAYIVAPK